MKKFMVSYKIGDEDSQIRLMDAEDYENAVQKAAAQINRFIVGSPSPPFSVTVKVWHAREKVLDSDTRR